MIIQTRIEASRSVWMAAGTPSCSISGGRWAHLRCMCSSSVAWKLWRNGATLLLDVIACLPLYHVLHRKAHAAAGWPHLQLVLDGRDANQLQTLLNLLAQLI